MPLLDVVNLHGVFADTFQPRALAELRLDHQSGGLLRAQVIVASGYVGARPEFEGVAVLLHAARV